MDTYTPTHFDPEEGLMVDILTIEYIYISELLRNGMFSMLNTENVHYFSLLNLVFS